MNKMISYNRLNCDARDIKQAKEQLVLGSRILANEGILDGLTSKYQKP